MAVSKQDSDPLLIVMRHDSFNIVASANHAHEIGRPCKVSSVCDEHVSYDEHRRAELRKAWHNYSDPEGGYAQGVQGRYPNRTILLADRLDKLFVLPDLVSCGALFVPASTRAYHIWLSG